MNESDYAALAAACDRLLRASQATAARLAIPLLHLIHEHPSWLSQYRSLFEPKRAPPIGDAVVHGARIARRLAAGLYHLPRARASSWMPVRENSPADVLFVSRLGNSAQLRAAEDFYFGSMPRLMRERGAKVVVALVDHRLDAAPFAGQTPGAQVLLPRALEPVEELALWRRRTAASFALEAEARRATRPLDRALARLASEQAVCASTAGQLRLHAHVKQLCAALRPRMVVTIFEGDASERLIWLAAREANDATLCVGYQHTRLLPRAHAVRRALGSTALPCDPHVVLTLGTETSATLAASRELGARCIVYGSHRRIAGNTLPAQGTRPPICLVLPDAEPGEYALLFDFMITCARHLPAITFVLRRHPASGDFLLRSRSIAPGELPPNVRISAEESLHRDAVAARFCLYRASSAVFHAVLAGARPLHLRRAGELPFDPLAALRAFRVTVQGPEDVAEIAAAPESADDGAFAAWRYCDRYVAPVRPAALDELLALKRSELRA